MKDGKTAEPRAVEEKPKKRRMQFSMRTLILAPLIMIVFVGLAVSVDAYASLVSYRLFGIGWEGEARNWLLGVGVPVRLVTGYVALALLRLPGWLVLAVVLFVLGLQRSAHAHFMAWLLALADPLSEFISVSWLVASDFFPDSVTPTYFYIQVVTAFGLALGIVAWFLGWWIRGRHYDDTAEHQITWMSRTVQIVVWTLVLIASGYGWTALASLR